MKKIVITIIVCIMCLCITACGNKPIYDDTIPDDIKKDSIVISAEKDNVATDATNSINDDATEQTNSINEDATEPTDFNDTTHSTEIDSSSETTNPTKSSKSENVDTVNSANTSSSTESTEPEVVVKDEAKVAPATPTIQSYSLPAFEQRILDIMNQHRRDAGLGELVCDASLVPCAQKRATEINSVMSHTRPDGTYFKTVLGEYGVALDTYCGENIARYFNDADRVMTKFMESDGHRENIMYPEYTRVGIGIYESPEYPGYYCVSVIFMGNAGCY